MKKKILFLGAGASIPFYQTRLTTAHLTTVIQDRNTWDDLGARYTRIMGHGVNHIEVDVILQTITDLLRFNPGMNFEQIIELIDKITSFNFSPLPHFKILHTLLNYYKATPTLDRHVWSHVPFLFRQLISEEIVRLSEQCKVINYDQLIQLNSEFISSISHDSNLNIFVLNYDDIIFDSTNTLDFEHGFNFEGRFNRVQFLNHPRVLSFPHGHIRFGYDGHGAIYNQDPKLGTTERLKNLGRSDMRETNYLKDSSYSYSFNTFLCTGQNKEPNFDVNPYSIYYQRFAKDTLEACIIYIIGYSFGDPHFNRMMINFLQLNPVNKIIIVDYVSGDINILNDSRDSNHLVNKIWLQFNPPIQFYGNYVYEHQTGIDQINQSGFGMLFSQVYLYKKGFDQFLTEHATLPI